MARIWAKVIVNMITGIRLVGTCIILPIYLNYGSLAMAIACIIIYLSDCLDGFLARFWHVESFFGSILDSVADKLFTLMSLIIMTTINPLFFLIILTELGISLINKWSADKGNHVESSFIGKAKTWVIAGAIILTLFLNALEISHASIYFYILAILTFLVDGYVLGDYYQKATIQNKYYKEQELSRKVKQGNLIWKSHEEIIHDLFDTEYYLKHQQDKLNNIFYKESSDRHDRRE